jgi:hypothetical protein
MVRRHHVALVAAVVLTSCSGDATDVSANSVTTQLLPSSSSTSTTTVPATTPTSTSTTTTTLPVISVSGRVIDPAGEPVSRAFVSMEATVAVTGPDGWFSLESTSPTTLAVSKPGWSSIELEWVEETTYYEASIEPVVIRGLRVSAEAAQSDDAFARLLELAADSAVNALVFDTKTEDGVVLYDTRLEVAHDIGAVSVFYDPAQRLEQAHSQGLYTITRIAAFEDDRRAEAFPDEALVGTWLDPASETARRYVLDLADEACQIGFDEIQFDYVRYPSGRAAETSGQRDLTQEQRLEAISSFLAEARALLHPQGCALSAAIFGIVASSPDDQGLGQRPEEMSAQVDVISPMVYPSHYSPGWLGFTEPNEQPYEVTADAIGDALPRLHETSTLRPYLQAFWWSNDQIRRSIQAAEDAGTGWLLWNVLSNYDSESLPSDDEVAG